MDAYVGNYGDITLEPPDKVWLNNGSGTFSDSGQNLGNDRARAVSLGDLDGDGDLDAFVGTSSGLQIWLNDGDGAFSDSSQSLGTANSNAVTLGDVDNDGDLDAFVSANSDNEVWLNNGRGLFSDSGQSLGAAAGNAVALGDVDQDGDLDAFVGHSGANKVWLNDGNGAFSDSGQNLGTATSNAVALGDVDQDGDLDAFIGNEETGDKIWLNDGSGVYSDSGHNLGTIASAALVLGDIDGDGDLDAFVGNNYWSFPKANKVWLNEIPLIVQTTYPSGNGQIVSADTPISVSFDQAYDPQTVSGHTIKVRGTETGPYIWTYDSSITDSLVIDTFGDFRPGEAVVVSLNEGLQTAEGDHVTPNTWQFRIAVNGGHGLFADSGQQLGEADGYAVALGDVDRDGDLDAFVVNRTNWDEGGGGDGLENKVWLNDGSGGFTDSGQDLGSAASSDVAFGDLDAFVANSNTASAVWLNDSTGIFNHSGQSIGSGNDTAVALGDVDGDGDLDAFVANESESALWLNDGSGNFSDSNEYLGGSTASDVALGDLDDDGDLDALLVHRFGVSNQVWSNDGQGNFIGETESVGAGDTLALALGDLDGDGDLDAFIGNGNGEANEVWLNDGSGTFSDSSQTLGSANTYDVVLGDVDGDGDLDAFVANDGASKVWLNNGTGIFTATGQNLDDTGSYGLALGDLDNDGDLDAYISNTRGEQGEGNPVDKVWLNLPLQLGISKTAPPTSLTGEPFTYTLVVTSSSYLTATNLVISDTIPAGANYLSGGTKDGDTVEWTVSELAPASAVTVTFAITVETIGSLLTPTLTITNDTYGVAADEGFSAAGEAAVSAIFNDPMPLAEFEAGNVQGSTPLTVTFTNFSTPTKNINLYLWDYGDGITGATSAFTHTRTYTQAGVFTVTLTVIGPGGTDVFTRWAVIRALGADFSVEPRFLPAPHEVTFTDILTDRVTGRTWDFGDGITETATSQITATHIYTQPGVYTPTLTVMREGHSYTEVKSAYVVVSGADFEATPRTGLAPLVVTFTDYFSDGVTYRAWDYGDGTLPFTTTGVISSANSLTTTHTYTQSGAYTVTLTVARDGYTHTRTVPNMILVHQAACSVSPPQVTWWDSNFFYRQPITLTVSQPLTYTPGVSQVLALTLDTQSLITDGLVLPSGDDLRVVYRDGAAWRELPRLLTDLDTAATTIAFPLQKTISDTAPDTDYYLYYGNLAPDAPPLPYQEVQGLSVLTATGTGTFTPTVSFTATTYNGLASLQVSFTNLTTPSTGISSYSWDFGDSGASSAANPSHTYTDQGLYTVTLTAVTTESLIVTNTWPAAIQVWGEDVSAQATAALDAQQTPVVTATICAGGTAPQTFTSADGMVALTFPPGSVQETIVITHTPLSTASLGEGIVGLFDVTAATLSGTLMTTFTDGVVVSMPYDDSGLEAWQEATLFGFVWNEGLDDWEYLPTSVDREDNVIYFSTSHFSPLGAGVLGQGPALPISALSAAQPDLYTGAATWSMPLHVPPGQGGLQPNLALSYNSQRVNDTMKQTTFQKSGWFGLGFTLGESFVEIDWGNLSPDTPQPAPPVGTIYWALAATDNVTFYLHLNGGRTKLIPQEWYLDDLGSSDLVATFRLEQDNFSRVQLMHRGAAENFAATSIEILDSDTKKHYTLSNLYWLVTTKDGTTYRFGYQSDSVKVDLISGFYLESIVPATAGGNTDKFLDMKLDSYPGRAYLDEVTDIYGNQMKFSYDNDDGHPLKQSIPRADGTKIEAEGIYNRYVRLQEVSYANNTRQVKFEYEHGRLDATQIQPPPTPQSTYLYPNLLSQAEMHVNGQSFLQYDFEYEEDASFLYIGLDNREPIPLLTNVTIAGGNETLPEVTLAYNRDNKLVEVDNGYGGVTTFEYNSDGLVDRQEFSPVDHSSPSIVHIFKYPSLGQTLPNNREVVVKELGPQRITHYFYHQDVDLKVWESPPADKVKTGHLELVSVRNDGLLYNSRLQTTCYYYDDDDLAAQAAAGDNVFVAPIKITTTFDGQCDESGDLVTEYDYDSYGNVQEITELGGPGTADDRRTTITYIYNPTAWVLNRPDVQTIEGKNAQGAWTQAAQTDHDYTYRNIQAALATQTTTQDGGANGVDLVTTAHFDSRGNITRLVDGAGKETLISYDEAGIFPQTTTYPGGGGQTSAEYDAGWGVVKQVTGLNGETTSYTYDELGRLEAMTDPTGLTTNYDYTFSADKLEVGISYDAYQTIETYNGLNQLLKSQTSREGGNAFVNYEYDGGGRLTRVSVPYSSGSPSQWTTTIYDGLARPIYIINPDLTRREVVYDGYEQTSIVDEEGNTTTYINDGLGRTIEVQDSYNESTLYTYDALNNPVEIKDPANNTTSMTYDGLGRQLSLSNPDTGAWSYEYDERGNLIRQEDAAGQVVCFYYDDANRLEGKSYLESGACPAGGNYPITYTYDRARRIQMDDDSGSTVWTYDSAGRLTQETKTILNETYSTTFTYDALSRVETMTYPDGEEVTYTYNLDGLNRMTTTEAESVYVDDIEYNVLGQPETMAFGSNGGGSNPLDLSYTYAPNTFRLNQLTIQNEAAQTLQSLSYTYDGAGNVKTLTGQIGPVGGGLNLIYNYDSLYRLTSASGTAFGDSYAYSYSYDNNVQTLTSKDGETLTYGSAKPHAVTAYNGITYDYDANGNRTTRQAGSDAVTYAYDEVNQLTEVVSDTVNGPITTTFIYDGDGNRVQSRSSEGEITHYVGDHYEVRKGGDIVDFVWTYDTSGSPDWYGLNWANVFGDQGAFIGWTGEDGSPDPGSTKISFAGAGECIPFFGGIQIAFCGGGAYYSTISPGGWGVENYHYNHPESNPAFLITPETEVSFRYKMVQVSGDLGGLSAQVGIEDNLPLSVLLTNPDESTGWITVTASLAEYAGLELGGLGFYNGPPGWSTVQDTYLDTISFTNLQEHSITTTVKHYYANGQRIATRLDDEVDNALYYMLGDHLGSTTVVADAEGNEVGHIFYDPYGAVLTNTIPATLTDRLFTGQRWTPSVGLYDYNARFYDPEVGQFTQADSLVPGLLNPQAWNRFGYVYNNPTNYTDPSGHWGCPAPWDCLDIAGFFSSAYAFDNDPTLGNLVGLALDTVGLLPLIPGTSIIRRGLGVVGDTQNVASATRTLGNSRFGDDVITLYHGTNSTYAKSIRQGIDLSKQRLNLDFNPVGQRGFYGTKDRAQAEVWSKRIAKRRGGQPAILEFQIPRSELEQLNGRIFLEANNEWAEFVVAGRRGTLEHSFDFVEGPMLRNPIEPVIWGAVPPKPTGHQLAIYTDRAVNLFQQHLR